MVLRSPWSRAVIAFAFVEAAVLFGAFTFVGADLHLRFGVSFTLVGMFVGAFAIGGLIYSLSVRVLVNRLGQSGLATGGGVLLALAFVTLAIEPHYWIAPAAILVIGLGFYMLHNTLQTNATQMTPEARGTAVAIFSSALYLGQTVRRRLRRMWCSTVSPRCRCFWARRPCCLDWDTGSRGNSSSGATRNSQCDG